MGNPKKHIDHEEFFANIKIPYSKSKDEVWNELSEKIDSKFEKKSIQLKANKNKLFIYSTAAAIFLFLGIAGFMKFYTVELFSPAGQHLSADLPDGSRVQLNAQTSITYKPFWWQFSRKLKLDGEAFFKVKKGKIFEVESEHATTMVLGTSFNVFSRNNTYKVHCFAGKVMVTSKKGANRILEPNQYVEVSDKKTTKIKNQENTKNLPAWIHNNFIFTGVPIKEVFEELERQFDIQIKTDNEISDNYTGNFKRGSSPEEILDLICKPFGLNYKKISSNSYIIQKRGY